MGTNPRVTGCSLELPEVALPPAWLRGGRVPGVSLCGCPGLLPTGLVQLRALARAGPGRLSPVQHSWSSSVGTGARGSTCNPQKCSFASLLLLLPSKLPQTQWHKATMSIYSYCFHLAWSGSCGLSQFSLGVSPGCRPSRVELSPRLPRAQVWWLMLALG